MAMEVISVLMACAILVVIIGAFYYFWDSSTIDSEESDTVEHETPEERAEIIAKHRAQIEEENERQRVPRYSEQDTLSDN